MKIFIQMGYVSRRRGARLHLDIDGFAHCGAGDRRIIGSGELSQASAAKICRRCERALRIHLNWRSDDLARRSTVEAAAELSVIETLLDGLDDLRGPEQKAETERILNGIRENLARLGDEETETRRDNVDIPDTNDQIALF